MRSENRLIDTHCHLRIKEGEESAIHALLARAQANGVEQMINVGAGEGVEGNVRAINLAESFPRVYATVGLHPHDAFLFNQDVLNQIEKLAQHKKVVAIGEMGLDFYYEHSPREIQREAFVSLIQLAKKMGKPIIVHDRGAGEETYEILKREDVSNHPVVIHCFSGSQELAKKYLDLGCNLSFTGIITFKKAENLCDIVRSTPLTRLLIETDSPYLAPVPFRGKPNEPAFVKYVAKKVALIKGISFEEVARVTSENAVRVFGI